MTTTMSENNDPRPASPGNGPVTGPATRPPLVRPQDGRMVAGVCAGLAAHFGIDVNRVRLGFAAFTIFWGVGALIYLIAWAVIPEPDGKSIVGNLTRKPR
jgi:phage shock protein PspC (stress-responsive transcriptional regulator)